MELKGQLVRHKTIGLGQIIDCNGSQLHVEFKSGTETFLYPGAFENYLSFEDETLQKEIGVILAKLKSEKKKHTSELSRTFTEDVFRKAYELLIEQADKNAVSKKSNGDKLPFGITKADDERIKEIDGGGRFGVGQHFGQGAASKTPYINWFVVSIYYMPDTGSVVMGIEKDRYPKLKQMEPRRYTQLGNKRTEVAVFFDSSKDYLNYEKLYNAFIDVSEQVMRLEGWA